MSKFFFVFFTLEKISVSTYDKLLLEKLVYGDKIILSIHQEICAILAIMCFYHTLLRYFFDGQHFLQVGGTAMSTRVAPTYANIFMDRFETDHGYTYRLQPRLSGRYIDDVLLLWDHGEYEYTRFVEHLNSVHPTIKFTDEHFTYRVLFLEP